jgi:ABC-2 type transport system ATP-binding protein
MIVSVTGLTKSFGSFRAVDHVSFGIARGQMAGLIGPNGAGKTTIVHTLLGLITADAGEIKLFGKTLTRHDPAIFQRLNFTSPYANFPGRLTVTENLLISARLYNVAKPKRIIAELLEQFHILPLAHRPVAALSSGEVTRMALCKAFLSKPELLLLDEPTAYMDPFAAQQTRETLLGLQQRLGTTILFTSHNMREVQQICDSVIVLFKGRVLSVGSPVEVTRSILREDRDAAALDEVFTHIAAAAVS